MKQLIGITSPPYEEAEDRLKYKFQEGRVSAMMPYAYDKEHQSKNKENIGNLKHQPQELDFDITQYHKCEGELYWQGCYGSDVYYKQFVTPESFAHPAKASFLLIERIFKHLEHLGLLKEGMTICDFMQGSGRIPLLASLRGYDSIGVELEPHFTRMCEDNKKFAENKVSRKLNFEIIQGDSRQLSKILNKDDVGVISPPFENSIGSGKSGLIDKFSKETGGEYTLTNKTYGDNPENIGNLPYKEMVGVVSPPYENADGHPSLGSVNKDDWGNEGKDITARRGLTGKYGESDNQIQSNSYLEAMLQVYQEAYKSGMQVICTITKNPTRRGILRRLDLDTAFLIEKSGFKIVDYHRAVLFKTIEQNTLSGEIKKEHKGRISFFKRLHMSKGGIAAQFEDILIAVRA